MQQKEVVKNERCTFEMYPLYWTPSKEGTFQLLYKLGLTNMYPK